MREKAMSRVAEVNFVGVNPDPLGRPVRYPSRAADNHCTMISQTAAQTPKAVAERPELYHGDTEVRPRPEPRAKSALSPQWQSRQRRSPPMTRPRPRFSTAPLCAVRTRSSRAEMVALSMTLSALGANATA